MTFHISPNLRLVIALAFAACATSLPAATCTWQSAVAANWHLATNWSGCSAGNGAPLGTPGPADRAVLPSGTGAALLDTQFTTIAELELAPGANLGVVANQIDTRQLTVNNSVSISSATLSGAMPLMGGGPTPATLSVQLPMGTTFTAAGTNLFRRAVLTSAGTATFNGGVGARLNLDLNGRYSNTADGATTVLGDYVFGYTTSGSVSSQGTWINQGPGMVSIERSGASGGQFTASGLFEIRSGTFKLLNPSAGFQAQFDTSLRLLGGTFDGGTNTLSIGTGKFLSGSGTVIGPVTVSGGMLDPYAANGDVIGTLNFVGDVSFGGAELVLDVSGPALAQHDRLAISGSVQWNRVSPRVRINDGYAPGIDTTIPIATHASVVAPNFPVHNRVLSDYPLSLALRVAPTVTDLRVVPTLTLADTAVTEGNSGSQVMNLAVTLSAPSSEIVSFVYNTSAGTAVTVAAGGNPADYLDSSGTVTFTPGMVLRQIPVTINGDAAVEADEGFSLVTSDSGFEPTLKNASFGNNKKFTATAEGLIRNDDGPSGTRYLLIGKSTNVPTPTGQVSFVRRYTTAGVAVDGWATLMQNAFGFVAAGFCRAPNGNVLSTRFADTLGVVLMSGAGAVRDGDFGGFISGDESCAFDQSGNAWIGEAVGSAATVGSLRYVAGDGRLLRTLQVPVGERGTDWIELDANQCTLYYTSEDSDVRRYDVCTEQVLPHFATGLEAPCYALRQLPNRDLMVTCKNRIYRYDQNGVFIRDYTRESLGETDINGLYAIHLDPDGETFWAGGVISGRVVRARIDDGSVVTSFTTGTGGVNGLLIQDEFVAGISLVLFKDGFEP